MQYSRSWGVCVHVHRYFEKGEASVDCTLDPPTEMNDVKCCKPHYSHSCSRVSLPTFTLQGVHLTHLRLQCARKIHFMILLQSVWLPSWVNISSFIIPKRTTSSGQQPKRGLLRHLICVSCQYQEESSSNRSSVTSLKFLTLDYVMRSQLLQTKLCKLVEDSKDRTHQSMKSLFEISFHNWSFCLKLNSVIYPSAHIMEHQRSIKPDFNIFCIHFCVTVHCRGLLRYLLCFFWKGFLRSLQFTFLYVSAFALKTKEKCRIAIS